MDMELGTKIRQMRLVASMTQEQLANRLGLSAQAVSKWENNVSMPDISLLPEIAEVFGISLDELFDLKADQKMRRIENRMELEQELPEDVFREYEVFLREQLLEEENRFRATSLLAHLYHHRLESDAQKAADYARRSISMAPETKECQWILQKAEGAVSWDWNIANHSRTIAFFKSLIEGQDDQQNAPMPYLYLIDNLIADHRTEEAKAYLSRLAQLPGHKPFMIPVYEAAIALAAFDEATADAIMQKAFSDFPQESGLLFEAAQYYARKCDYDKAIHFYEAAYATDEREPRFTDALDAIAVIHEIRGEYGKAADTRRRVLHSLKNEWGFTEETIIRETEEEIQRLLQKVGTVDQIQ